MLQRFLNRFSLTGLPMVLVWGVAAGGLVMAADSEWLSLCGQCLSPSVTSKSGIGTSHAVAEAKVNRQDAAGWCANWQPSDKPEPCIREQLAAAGNKTYRAMADCTAGRLTAIDGKSYALAGAWGPGIGQGRSRWREAATGAMVGRDEASGGLALAQQWEVLCPAAGGPAARSTASPAAAPHGPTTSAQPRPGARMDPAANQPPPVCPGQARCTEVATFAGTITDFRLSANGRHKVLIATVRFQNKLARPLILGYLQSSGVATDDQGNRYEVYPASVRGIGTIASSTVDPKFVLQPGEASDGRFEFVFAPSGHEILGTAYDLDMTIREINPLPGNQFRLGLEHAIHFQGLGGAPAPAAAPPQPIAGMAPTGSAATQTQMPEPADLCGGKPRCYSAGLFLAEVTQTSASQAKPGAHHVVRFNVRFRNVTNQPLTLGYKAGSSSATDNFGNPYYYGRAGTHDTSSTGIGLVTGGNADPSFRLNPGEAREASFQIIRFSPGNTALGSVFTWNIAVEQLEILPGNQVRTTREYSLNFQNLGTSLPSPLGQPSESLGDAARKLRDIFGKKK